MKLTVMLYKYHNDVDDDQGGILSQATEFASCSYWWQILHIW